MKPGSHTAKLNWFTLLLITVAFFVPCVPGMISQDLTYSLMDEPGFVLNGMEKGLFGAISHLVHTYHSEGWQRNHFVGLFLDQFVGWAFPSPSSFRILRLVEGVGLSLFFIAILNLYANRLGRRIKIMFFLAVLSALSLFFVRPLFYVSIYEFEGSLLTVASFYFLFFTRPSFKWIGLLLIPILWFTKETFVTSSLAVLAFILIAHKFLKGPTHRLSQAQKYSAFGLFLGTLVVTLFFAGNRSSAYAAQHPESPLSLFPEYVFNVITAYSTLVPFVLVVLFAIMIISQTVSKNELWQESRNALVISAFFGLMAFGYGALLYPWGKVLWSSYYYLPVKIWSALSICLFASVLFNHLWPRIRDIRYVYYSIGTALIITAASNGFLFHRKVMSNLFRMHDVLTLNDTIAALSTHEKLKPVFFTYLYEKATRLNENATLLRADKKSYDYEVLFQKEKLLNCWSSKTCNLLIVDQEAMDPELDTLFRKSEGAIFQEIAGFKIFLRKHQL